MSDHMLKKLTMLIRVVLLSVLLNPVIASTSMAQTSEPLELRTKYVPQVRFGRYHVLAPKTFVADTTYRVVLLLHGNGHGPEVMLDWARQLNLPNAIFIAPEAPYLKWKESKESFTDKYMGILIDSTVPDSMQAEVINTSAQWYHDVLHDVLATYRGMTLKRSEFEVPSGSRASNRSALRLSKPFVIGFSQGGFFAQVLATRHPDELAGVVSLSGSMYAAGGVFERYPALRGMPVLLCHGRQDPTVPFKVATECTDALSQAKVEYTFIPFDGGHWPTADVTVQVRKWLESR